MEKIIKNTALNIVVKIKKTIYFLVQIRSSKEFQNKYKNIVFEIKCKNQPCTKL